MKGFSNTAEQLPSVLIPSSRLPIWLKGRLIRNGPGLFTIGREQYHHWFDGLAMLHQFTFNKGTIHYQSQFLKTEAYLSNIKANRIVSQEFGTNPNASWLQRIKHIIKPTIPSNTSINVCKLFDKYVAMTESTRQTEFDPKTLATLGEYQYQDKLNNPITTAHPQFDKEGRYYNIETRIGFNFKTIRSVVSIEPGLNTRKVLSQFSRKQFHYLHSFAMTERYIIIIETPLTLNFKSMLLQYKSYSESLEWNDREATEFIVIDKSNGKILKRIETCAFFFFHTIHADEQPDSIVIDLAEFKDASIIPSLNLNNISENNIPSAILSRYRISLKEGKIYREKKSDVFLELPTVYFKKQYQHIYAASGIYEGYFLNSLVKIDVRTGNYMRWHEEKTYPGEPIFVPRPNATSDDDGVVLSVVQDTVKNTSFILILDGASFTEIARAYTPSIIPFGFHGVFA